MVAGKKLSDRHDRYSNEELLSLNRTEISAFDRPATSNYSPKSGKKSDVLRNTAWVLPAVFLPQKRIRKDFGIVTVMALETFLIAQGGTTVVKGAVGRTRPFLYNPEVGVDEKTGSGTKLSFFSGHTSMSAALSFFVAKVINDYSTNTAVKWSVWSGAALLPATVGYLRVRAGKHFPTDVMTGYAFGALVGFIIPHLHKHREAKVTRLAMTPAVHAGGAMGVSLNWKLASSTLSR